MRSVRQTETEYNEYNNGDGGEPYDQRGQLIPKETLLILVAVFHFAMKKRRKAATSGEFHQHALAVIGSP